MVDYQLMTSVTTQYGQYFRLNSTVKVQVCNKYFVQKCRFLRKIPSKYAQYVAKKGSIATYITVVYACIKRCPAPVPSQHVYCLPRPNSKTADTSRMSCHWLTTNLTDRKFTNPTAICDHWQRQMGQFPLFIQLQRNTKRRWITSFALTSVTETGKRRLSSKLTNICLRYKKNLPHRASTNK